MRILLPHDSSKFTGGGSSFVRNFTKAMKTYGHSVVTSGDYDVLFIAGPTLVSRETVNDARSESKPIVLRVDNILEDRRNRNSGMVRMRKYAEVATVIVYQSSWAERLLSPILERDGVVFVNGVDTDIFRPAEKNENTAGRRIFYSRNSRNETKQAHEVEAWWREYNLTNKDDTLVIVGNFSRETLQSDHPFEFHNGESYEYHGMVEDQNKLADIIRSCDVAFLPYMFDACPNTVLEVQACGVPVLYSPTGGTREIVSYGKEIDYRLLTPEQMVDDVIKNTSFSFADFSAEYSLDTMGERYDGLFRLISLPEYEV